MNIDKRVVLYSHNANLSGAPISLSLLAKELPNHGFQPLLVIPKHGPLEEKLARWGVDYRVLRRENALWQLGRIIRQEDPVVVHVNTIMKTCPVILARLLRRPVVWHVRENMGGKYLDARMIHLLADWVILICREQHRLFSTYRNVSVIPNGVEIEEFRNVPPADLPVAHRAVTVSYVGSIQPRKGLLEVARAAALLKNRPWIQFVVAGDAPPGDRYKQEVLDLVEREGLTGRFHFLGYREDIPRILSASSMFCFPAFLEPFGRVVIEAMAAGLPVIATRVGEIPRMVNSGENGFLVDPGDAEGLARAIRALDDDRELGRRMGRAGLARVREHFSIQVHTELVAQVYRTLLKKT